MLTSGVKHFCETCNNCYKQEQSLSRIIQNVKKRIDAKLGSLSGEGREGGGDTLKPVELFEANFIFRLSFAVCCVIWRSRPMKAYV